MTTDQLMAKIEADIKRAGSQKAFAEECGLSESYISELLRKRRDPGPTILAYYGLKRKVIYASENGKK